MSRQAEPMRVCPGSPPHRSMPGVEEISVGLSSLTIRANFILRRVPKIIVVDDSLCWWARGCSRPPRQSSEKAVVGRAIVVRETVRDGKVLPSVSFGRVPPHRLGGKRKRQHRTLEPKMHRIPSPCWAHRRKVWPEVSWSCAEAVSGTSW